MVSTTWSLGDIPLVVIDVVKGCCDIRYERPEWGLHFSKTREMIPKLNTFTEKHRENGGQVIWIKPTPWTKENLPKNINKLYSENPMACFYVEDNIEEYNEFPEELIVDPEDHVLEKNNYSAFVNPKLQDLIDESCLIAGIYADGCVNATIIEGWSKGYFTYIISDLVESMDAKVKQDQKKHLLSHMWPMMYGHIIESSSMYTLP